MEISNGNERQSEYLNISEIAAKLNVSIHTVRDWRKQNILPPAYKFGRAVRWKLTDIDKWIADHREKTRQAAERMVRVGEYFKELKRQGKRWPERI